MPLVELEHYLIRAKDLEATKNFYVEVLGLRAGERPPFNFPGYWLYLGDTACVHLTTAESNKNMEHYIGAKEVVAGDTGALDHVAFHATGLKDFVDRATARNVAMKHRRVPDLGLHQVFLHDPDGLTIELNYPAEEAADFDPEA